MGAGVWTKERRVQLDWEGSAGLLSLFTLLVLSVGSREGSKSTG